MADVFVLIGIILLSLYGLRTLISHTKGEGSGCCNTSGKPLEIKKKHHAPIICKMIFVVNGMHCDACRIRVQNELNGVDGVVAHVNLKKGQAVIECEKKIDQNILINCIESCGYQAYLLSDYES